MFNRSYAVLAALTGAGLGAVAQHSGISDALARNLAPQERRIFGFENIRHHITQSRKRFRITSHFDARINRHTGYPHFDQRETARRMTRPGTPERKAAMEAIRHG